MPKLKQFEFNFPADYLKVRDLQDRVKRLPIERQYSYKLSVWGGRIMLVYCNMGYGSIYATPDTYIIHGLGWTVELQASAITKVVWSYIE